MAAAAGARPIHLAYVAAAQLYWIGSFFSNFLPTGVGGDAVRLMLTLRTDGRGPVAASILVERLSGLFAALSACALVVLPLDLGLGLPRLVLVAGVLGLATVTLAILYLPSFFLAACSWSSRACRASPAGRSTSRDAWPPACSAAVVMPARSRSPSSIRSRSTAR